MNAMILAAGLGTRLGDLGRTLPKVLVEIGNRPLLERHLSYLERQGIRRVVINTHHHAERIESFVERYDGPLEVISLFEERLLGTAGGVRNALRWLEPGPFLVVYGDVFIDEPIDSILECHQSSRAIATLAVHEADASEGKGVVEVAPTGRVTGFKEKELRGPGRVLVNSGIYVLESSIMTLVPPGEEADFGRDVFPRALERGLSIYAAPLGSPVIDIGTPEGLSLARSRVGASTVSRHPRP